MCQLRAIMDVVVGKWPGSVHDPRIFQNPSLNKMLKDGAMSPCPKSIIPKRDPVSTFLLEDSEYPLLLYVMKEIQGVEKTIGRDFFLKNCLVPV